MSLTSTVRLTLGAAACCLLVAGCTSGGAASNASNSSSGNQTRTFTGDNGDVTIPAKPQRIVATGYAVPVLLESDAPMVGISEWSRGVAMMSDEVRAKYEKTTKIGGNLASETNYEAIAKAKPDLIILSVPKPVLGDIDMNRLKSVAPVVVIPPTKPDAWKELSAKQLDAAGQQDSLKKSKEAYEKKTGELKNKYATALAGKKFGHLGGYGRVDKGSFHREFAKSWGTNIAGDIGVNYYGEVKENKGGGLSTSEYPAVEEMTASFSEADYITYTLQPDGVAAPPVKNALDHPLWAKLPAVEAKRAIGVKYTEAATYQSALRTLDELDKVLGPVLTP